MQLSIGYYISCIFVCSSMKGVLSEGRYRTPQATYTIELERELQPLHSDDGIIQHKSAYHGELSLGGPTAQHMKVVFDTGSGHLVVPSAVCKSLACKKKRRFKRKGSSTAEDINLKGEPHPFVAGEPRDSLTIAYGTGEVVGILMKDFVCLGTQQDPIGDSIQTNSLLQKPALAVEKVAVPAEEGDEVPEIVEPVEPTPRELAMKQVVERVGKHGCSDLQFIYAVDMSDDPFANYNFDGVLGLGLPSLSESPDFNYMQVAVSQKAWLGMPGLEWVFSFFLAWSDEEKSQITFGGIDLNKIGTDAELAWHAVQSVELGYWQVKVNEIWANGTKLNFCDDGTCRAIVDTGTSLLAVPASMGLALQGPLRHRADETMCNGQGPQLQFVLDGITITLDPVDIARPEVVTDPTYEHFNSSQGGSNDSVSEVSVQPKEVPLPSEGSAMGALELPTDGGPQMCVAMLMYIDLQAPLHEKTIVFGEPVLQKYYTSFDASPEHPRIGFAEAVHGGNRKLQTFV